MEFITNREKLLKEMMENIIPTSDMLYFLVGYFYFSGFELLKDSLKDKKLKILVGMDIDKDLNNQIKEYFYIKSKDNYIPDSLIQKRFCESIKEVFETDIFDNAESFNKYRLFKEKLENGSLEIKKTREPNHAKLYLFEKKKELNEGGTYPGAVITGSSNLSYSGIKAQDEINVLSREKNDYLEAKTIFDKLWEESVKLFDKNNLDFFYNLIDKKVPVDKLPKPYLLYIKILEEYFNIARDKNIKLPSSITDGKYYNFQYQIDAIVDSLEKIKTHKGVIISDVVGLGKSIIASTVAHNLGLKTIIICPPHLKEQWDDYRIEFDINARIYTSGSVNKANIELENDYKEKLIIVDECHKYRNSLTKDYGELWKLCQGNKVILLSATPFNNKPDDIYSMVKLFQIPAKSTIQTVDNLYYQFWTLIKEYKNIQKGQREKKIDEVNLKIMIKQISKNIRDIISPLVIRRTRLDLEEIEIYKEDLKMQNISFPKVLDPILLEYNLAELSSLYKKTLNDITPDNEEKGFIGARYKPVTYLKNFEKYKEKITNEFGDVNLFEQTQRNLAKFMKKLLVRRFESSIYSFKSTLDNIIKSNEIIEEWYEKLNLVPIFKRGMLPNVEEMYESNDDEEIKEMFPEYVFDKNLDYYKARGLETIEAKELKKGFIDDVKKDIKLLKDIKKDWFPDNKIINDPKLEHFKKIITGMIKKESNRKIVVFTEFNDTANYIYVHINKEFKVFKYSSENTSTENKKIIKENFDAGFDIQKQKNNYDILIATDAISEGFNLNRAGAVFNYDIPYNPTRVIQRVGRINRINKKMFNELFIYNFFPTEIGESETRTKQISTLKISVIQSLLGEDTKVLTKDEELQTYFNEQYRVNNDDESASWDNKYRNFIEYLKKDKPELIEEVKNIPKRVRIRREKKNDKGIIIFAKKGSEYVFKIGKDKNDIKIISPEQAINIFKADIPENAKQVSDKFEELYQFMKNNLFVKKTQTPIDEGLRESIAKVEYLKNKIKDKEEYFTNLLKAMKDFNALPDVYAKLIRNISEKNLQEDVNNLEKEIPNDYLIKLIDKANNIDEGEETLILSEELF